MHPTTAPAVKRGTRHAPRQRARRRALQALYQWQLTGQPAAEIVAQFRAVQDLSGVDVGYFTALLEGVTAACATLDQQLAPLLDRAMGQVDPVEKAVLRIGAWELLHVRDLPCQVVLDEATDLAHRFGAEQGHAWVNAVLDRAARAWRPGEIG